MTGALAPNNHLQKAMRLYENEVKGPESILVDGGIVNRSLGFLTYSDTNQPVQSQKKARSIELWIKEGGSYYPCSESNSANHLCRY